MQIFDHHIHTSLCNHASGKMIDYVRSAIENGLDGIGFSDHSPFLEEYENRFRMLESEMEIYVETVFSLKEKFKGEIQIKLGIELDYAQEAEEYLSKFVSKYPFDFVIGSVHYLPAGNGKHSYLADLDRNNRDANFSFYFEKIKQAANSGLFDIIAHYDLPKKFWNGMDERQLEKALKALECIKENQMAIELNTSGLRTVALNETFPGPEIIKAAKDLNIPITLGSDSHSPKEVGSFFDEAFDILREHKIERVSTFKKRERIDFML